MADFRSAKAAVKMHPLLDLRGSIPSFIHVSSGKMHDSSVLDLIVPEPGAIYVMDRGYLDFGRLYALHQVGSFFVTRAKSNMDFHRVYSPDVDKLTGAIADQSIMLDGFYAQQNYPHHLHWIRFHDPENEKKLIFLTNNFAFPATTIAAFYKQRWQVDIDQAW